MGWTRAHYAVAARSSAPSATAALLTGWLVAFVWMGDVRADGVDRGSVESATADTEASARPGIEHLTYDEAGTDPVTGRGPDAYDTVDERNATGADLEREASAAEGRGHPERAAALWQQASKAGAAEGDANAEWRAGLRQGEALRRAGRLRESEAALAASLEIARELERPGAMAASLAALAATRSAAGDHERARAALLQADRLARAAGEERIAAAIANERGNLEAAEGQVDAALEAYAEAVRLALAGGERGIALRAAANRAELATREAEPLVASGSLDEAIDLARDVRASSYDLVRIARAAIALGDRLPEQRDARLDAASTLLARASAGVGASGDSAARSWVLGARGELAAERGKVDESLALTHGALRAAQVAERPEARLRWRVQAAELELSRGNLDAAIAQYERAAELADELRRSLGAGATGTPRAPQDVANASLRLTDLLLQRAARAADSRAAEPDLVAAQQHLERGKADELRDYFRDDCVDTYREKLTDPATASASAAVIYPVPLPDRLELLVSGVGGIRRFSVPVEAAQLETEARRLRGLLEKRTTHQYLRSARTLYDWVIAPIRPHLEALGVDTLVFVPGGALRAIPMAALHDGDRFLIESFALAITPGLDLTDPGPIDREGLSLFLAGLTEAREGFGSLPHVREEIDAIQQIYPADVLLMDEQFERAAVERHLRAREFTVVHIATHAKFGETPDDTFLLTHDGRLTMDALADQVGAFRYRETPLDLIVLSACETAAGDERAALGLAGVAVRAGARSALGSLWAVADVATATLISEFYAQLADPTVSRAHALQRAQRKLLATKRMRHPAFWSPFVLINNWL